MNATASRPRTFCTARPCAVAEFAAFCADYGRNFQNESREIDEIDEMCELGKINRYDSAAFAAHFARSPQLCVTIGKVANVTVPSFSPDLSL